MPLKYLSEIVLFRHIKKWTFPLTPLVDQGPLNLKGDVLGMPPARPESRSPIGENLGYPPELTYFRGGSFGLVKFRDLTLVPSV